jgi:hypothetical protein
MINLILVPYLLLLIKRERAARLIQIKQAREQIDGSPTRVRVLV